MNAVLIYEKINAWFSKITRENNISHPEKYLSSTDFSIYSLFRRNFGFKDINDPSLTVKDKKKYLFAQFCYHAQNATMINNIIKINDYPNFKNKENVLKDVFCDFDYDEFLNKYKDKSRYEIAKLVYDSGLTWKFKRDENLVPYEEYDFSTSLVAEYFVTLLNIARYLSSENVTRESFIEEMKSLIPTNERHNLKQIRLFFMSHGFEKFKEALTADFIKELDPYFNYLCKPDIHIKEFLNTIYGEIDEDSYMSKYDEFINELNSQINVSGYEVDRKIYLISSRMFFLDNKRPRTKYKEAFLEDLKTVL